MLACKKIYIFSFLFILPLFIPSINAAKPKKRAVQPPPVKINWIEINNREMFAGFAPTSNENVTLNTMKHRGLGPMIQGRQLEFFATAAAAAAGVMGILDGAISTGRGLASLIKDGIEIAELFGFSLKENAILIDSRCNECNMTVRCMSLLKDTGYFEVNYPDGFILKFTTFLPSGLPFNIGLTHYKCEYLDVKTGRRVTNDAFGGKSPRQLFNLFEVRPRGVWHMDMETGRIDGRQPVAWW